MMPGVDDADVDNAERQTREVSLLQAMYPSEFFWTSNRSTESPVSFGIQCQEKIALRISLPRGYPTHGNPVVTFTSPNLSKSEHHTLQSSLNDLLSSLCSSTEERLNEIIESFIDSIPKLPTSAQSGAEATIPEPSVRQQPTFIIIIWFHHLLSTTKRKNILALESLRGISKPGYPGILVLQGPESDLDKALSELKAMRWQAMQVRGEIECTENLESGLQEVETVAEVVKRMEGIGLGDWCLSSLRMK